MRAEVVGRRLLDEVEEAGLDEVLRSVRTSAHPELSSSRFGIPPLDRLLYLSQQHSTPPPQAHHQELGGPLPSRRPPAKLPLIELTSIGPGQGKTHLLYLITTLAILPTYYDRIPLSGKNSAVIIIDTDNRFSVARLAQVIRNHITHCIQRASAATAAPDGRPPRTIDTDALLATSLTHAHILRPQSHPSLLSTLHALPAYLASPTAHPSSHRPLHSILLDSASAFFWPLRAAEDDARAARLTTGTQTPLAAAKPSSTATAAAYADLASALRRLSARFDAVVVATTASLPLRPGDANAASGARPLLPPAFTNGFAAAVRLVVGREAVAVFAPAMSVAEAVGERAQRQGVVERGRFGIRVEGGRRGRDGWGFVVGGEGVWVVEEEGDGEEEV